MTPLDIASLGSLGAQLGQQLQGQQQSQYAQNQLAQLQAQQQHMHMQHLQELLGMGPRAPLIGMPVKPARCAYCGVKRDHAARRCDACGAPL